MNAASTAELTSGQRIVDLYQKQWESLKACRDLSKPPVFAQTVLAFVESSAFIDSYAHEMSEDELRELGTLTMNSYVANRDYRADLEEARAVSRTRSAEIFNLMGSLTGRHAVVTTPDETSRAILHGGYRWQDERRHTKESLTRAEGVISENADSHVFYIKPSGRLSRLALNGYRIRPIDWDTGKPQVDIDVLG